MYINAVILSEMSYCLPVWCLTSNETLKPVKLLYNCANKICVNVTYRSHHCTALEKASALKFDTHLKLTSMKLYYQIQHTLFPSLISSLLPRLSNTRQTQITCAITNRENPLPRYKNIQDIINWNNIPLNLRRSSSLLSFKQQYTDLGKYKIIGLPQDKARKSKLPLRCLVVLFYLSLILFF